MSVTTKYTCDECSKDMGTGPAMTFKFPSRLEMGLGGDVHVCSERCGAKQLRKVAARFDEMARWREEHDAALEAHQAAVKAQAEAEEQAIRSAASQKRFDEAHANGEPPPATPA
jgi:hypothetical protein